MGALPSRETQRRGLYSHRHGRNRKSEVILVPLTSEFFPSEDCPLFQCLYQARYHRTAKYYYRTVRSANTDRDTDFYCQTTAHAHSVDSSGPDGFVDDGLLETRFTDSISGLYYRLVEEAEYCMCETDEELRKRYKEQIRDQKRRHHPHNHMNTMEGLHGDHFSSGRVAYVNGYEDAAAYMNGKDRHTRRNEFGTHVTSPAAYYLRPVPCAIVSRTEPQKSSTEFVADFLGSKVKVLGMFGLLPSTIPITMGDMRVDQHMLKTTMFVDKDGGDQILGNVVTLGAYMYVRQCMEAGIRGPFIPMIPMMLRTPISNVPMLQFLREMRWRLRGLLDAGQPRRGGVAVRHQRLSSTTGSGSLSSFTSGEIAHDVLDTPFCREADVRYLFEEDVANAESDQQLFMDSTEVASLRFPSVQAADPSTHIPILLVSGVNVQTTSFMHSSLTNMSHVRVPPWAVEGGADGAAGTMPTHQREASRMASLQVVRRSRLRVWVESGHLCVWASAAYARRGCLMLAQQLTDMVSTNPAPPMRAWNYRGLLRGGIAMPAPALVNDVFIVAHDMPSVGLFQGDILRCSTPVEISEMQQFIAGKPPHSPLSASDVAFPHRGGSLNSTSVQTEPQSPHRQGTAPVNYTSNHPSNVLLQDPGEAPPNAFWVRVSEAEVAPLGSSERRQQQHHQDLVSHRVINVEEVLLSWIKTIFIRTRDVNEDDEHWVRDPTTGAPHRVDRYVIRRVEHDGMRYFIGVAPRFVGQQRRLEKVLGEIRAQNSEDDAGEDEQERVGMVPMLNG
ncbi:unnamed protein product [Trypanosoma congolense IL3000]|uniref:WGS project CAEQ00000000 data, annotated contig 1871 n=1 Tax=Trypanosoma congolense (strain IL3000) TaxID=1068625 RepID=F9W9K0_TRYCI|nr:unnamed protein product [Trypanosoma congolense IL3000]